MAETLNALWNKFDRKVVLTCTDNLERHSSLRGELARVGMENVEFSIDSPGMDMTFLGQQLKGYPGVGRHGIECTMHHYREVTKAYNLGCKSLIVIEDDICFLKDTDKIAEILKSLPPDYEIALGDVIRAPLALSRSRQGKDFFVSSHWINGPKLYSAAFVIYSRSGMKAVMDVINQGLAERRYLPIDHVWGRGWAKCKVCGAVPNLVIQQAFGGRSFTNPIARVYAGLEQVGISLALYNVKQEPLTKANVQEKLLERLDCNRELPSAIAAFLPGEDCCENDHENERTKVIKNTRFFQELHHDAKGADGEACFAWGYEPSFWNCAVTEEARARDGRIYIAEYGPIQRLDGREEIADFDEYSVLSVVMDRGGAYYDATRETDCERTIAGQKELLPRQIEQVETICSLVRDNGICNDISAPDLNLPPVAMNKKRILVVDQPQADLSIEYGLANGDTFRKMLAAAKKENPKDEIIVLAREGGHYDTLESKGRTTVVKERVNTVSLVAQCDKVYVCTSMVGLEALMCGRPTRVFGMPFFAGWGLTKDEIKPIRPRRQRSLHELLYAYLFRYVHWLDRFTHKEIEAYQAINSIAEWASNRRQNLDSGRKRMLVFFEDGSEQERYCCDYAVSKANQYKPADVEVCVASPVPYKGDATWIDVSTIIPILGLSEMVNQTTSRKFSQSAVIMLLLRQFIPLMDAFKDAEKVLSMDTDTEIVSKKFFDIFDIDMGENEILACHDKYLESRRWAEQSILRDKKARRALPRFALTRLQRNNYYNAGVFLMNPALVRANRPDLLDDFMLMIPMVLTRDWYYDQDIMNMYYRIGSLPPEYNYIKPIGGVGEPLCLHYAGMKKNKAEYPPKQRAALLKKEEIVKKETTFKVSAEAVPERIFCFWTGENPLTANREKGLKTMQENLGVSVEFLDAEGIEKYIKPEAPLHPAYRYLTAVHKSDYLRSYFMHYYGGGYADIKPYSTSNNWKKCFEEMNANPNLLCIGRFEETSFYKEYREAPETLAKLLANGWFICRPQTEFTKEWVRRVNAKLDEVYQKLEKHPAKSPTSAGRGYPLRYEELQSAIFHKLILDFGGVPSGQFSNSLIPGWDRKKAYR